MLAKSGNIDAGCPVLDLKGTHPFFIMVKLEWFQIGLYAGLVFHGILPSCTGGGEGLVPRHA